MSVPEIVYDATGRVLEPGQLILITTPMLGRVKEVRKALDPNLPANAIEVELHAVRKVLCAATGLLGDVFIVQGPPKVADEAKAKGLVVAP